MRTAAALFRVCARITGDRALAEDAVQEALLNAFRHLADFDGRSAFSTWLYRIAVNAALAQVRKRRYLEVAWPEGEGDAATPFDAADDSPTPDRQAMSARNPPPTSKRELARMTPIERAAFVLRHQEGRSLEEISRGALAQRQRCEAGDLSRGAQAARRAGSARRTRMNPITDDDLVLYHYRDGLDAARIEQIAAALADIAGIARALRRDRARNRAV